MSNLAYDSNQDSAAPAHSDAAAMQTLRPVPRISIQAFCETESVANPIERPVEPCGPKRDVLRWPRHDIGR